MDREKEIKDVLMVKKHDYCINPKVTVIVPVYKVDKYLVKCLDSIVNQTLEELEIIIIDEGDKDRCREIIDFFEKSDPRILAPHKKNGGYGASCNLGIRMARGEYLAIVESDDFIEPEMYEEMYLYAKTLEADVVKTPYYEYFSNGERRDCSYRKYMQEMMPSNKCFSMKEFGQLLQVHASLWSGLYKTKYMKDNNIRFVEAKGGAYVDVGFRIQTLINTDKIAWLDKPYYNYRIDSIDSTTNNFKLLPMIKRWTEMHNMFVNIKDDYDKYYAPFLILDEYLNTLGYFPLIKVSEEECEEIYKNMLCITDETLEKTTSLNEDQKKDILEFKNDHRKYYDKKQKLFKIRESYKKKKKIIERELNRWTNINLAIWFTIGLIASLSIIQYINIADYKFEYLKSFLELFALLNFVGIIICFLCKILKKIYFIIQDIYRK